MLGCGEHRAGVLWPGEGCPKCSSGVFDDVVVDDLQLGTRKCGKCCSDEFSIRNELRTMSGHCFLRILRRSSSNG